MQDVLTSSDRESLSDRASNEDIEAVSDRHSSGCSRSQATSLSALGVLLLESPASEKLSIRINSYNKVILLTTIITCVYKLSYMISLSVSNWRVLERYII